MSISLQVQASYYRDIKTNLNSTKCEYRTGTEPRKKTMMFAKQKSGDNIRNEYDHHNNHCELKITSERKNAAAA